MLEYMPKGLCMERKTICKKDVIEFFNDRASSWDANIKKRDDVINTILDNCQIKNATRVLDVATGTGVLFDYYIQRGVIADGIDISERMIEIAKGKYPDCRFMIGDAELLETDERYDAIVIYNAFPHFINPEGLIENLTGLLKENGRVTIAHGMSREKINSIHHDGAQHVSNGLMEIDELEKIMEKYLEIEVKISNDDMYQIVGKKVC